MALNGDIAHQRSLILDDEANKLKREFHEVLLFKEAMKNDVKAFEIALERALNNGLVIDDIYNASSMNCNSLIHVAAKFGSGDIVRAIAGHDDLCFMLTKRNSSGDTVLHMAVRAEDESSFDALKDIREECLAKADVESSSAWKDALLTVSNNKGNTALHEALIHRREDMAKYLMTTLLDRDVYFSVNSDGKSALYLSVEARYLDCVEYMLSYVQNDNIVYEKLEEGKSVILAAVNGCHTDILRMLVEMLPKLKHVKDNKGQNPLHLAASVGDIQMTRDLLKSRHSLGLNETDSKGFMPIHYAASKNHARVMKELLRHYHDPCELVTREGKNILHVAAKFGSYNVVRSILNSPDLKMLLNQKDDDGNTPLHLASKECCPRIVSAFTCDNRVKVDARNKKDQSAIDVIGSSASASDQAFKQALTWAALKAAKAPNFKHQPRSKKESAETSKDRVNTLLLVSTLVVTVTFAAGFTMPGAYNGPETPNDPGMAINLKHFTFQVFVVSNTMAMYTAMLVVVVLMWAQLGDHRIMKAFLQLALPLLGSALSMMCIAFMTSVYVTVRRLRWIAIFILIFGCSFLGVIAGLFFLLGFKADLNQRFIRTVTYYVTAAIYALDNS